jgi:hypothetical protein
VSRDAWIVQALLTELEVVAPAPKLVGRERPRRPYTRARIMPTGSHAYRAVDVASGDTIEGTVCGTCAIPLRTRPVGSATRSSTPDYRVRPHQSEAGVPRKRPCRGRCQCSCSDAYVGLCETNAWELVRNEGHVARRRLLTTTHGDEIIVCGGGQRRAGTWRWSGGICRVRANSRTGATRATESLSGRTMSTGSASRRSGAAGFRSLSSSCRDRRIGNGDHRSIRR